MKEVVFGLIGTGLLMAYEDDLKRLRYVIPRRIKKIICKVRHREYGWEDYTIFSLAVLVLSLAYILIRYS